MAANLPGAETSLTEVPATLVYVRVQVLRAFLLLAVAGTKQSKGLPVPPWRVSPGPRIQA
jgi:hypothetical protein